MSYRSPYYGGGGGTYGGSGDRYFAGQTPYYSGFSQGAYPQRYQQIKAEDIDPEAEHFRKIFVGGLSTETTMEMLKEYFKKFGTIKDAIVMKDPATKKSRGFGFVTFGLAENVDEVQKNRPHNINEKVVDTKRAVLKEDANNPIAKLVTYKIFIGGLHSDTSDDELKTICEKNGGETEKIEIIREKPSGKSKGYAFVTFKDTDYVDKIVLIHYIKVKGKMAEFKKAIDKEFERGEPAAYPQQPWAIMQQSRGGRSMRGGGHANRDFFPSYNRGNPMAYNNYDYGSYTSGNYDNGGYSTASGYNYDYNNGCDYTMGSNYLSNYSTSFRNYIDRPDGYNGQSNYQGSYR